MQVTLVSVYAQQTWHLYEQQAQFIAATTPGARHVVVSIDRPPFNCDWLPAPEMATAHHSYQHAIGLRTSMRAIGNKGVAVLCDSDAFPVAADWPDTVLRCLRNNGLAFAAPVRTETGDCFPHVSFLVFPCAKKDGIVQHLRVAEGRTVFGRLRLDTGGRLPLKQCFPLLRSNRSNPHPWLHAIYGDLAYHRCRGTCPGFHGQAWKYWEQLVPVPEPADPRTAEEMVPLINQLLGERRFAYQGKVVFA